MNASNPLRNVVWLASDAVGKTADLIRLEFRLARAELIEKMAEVRTGVGLLLVGAVFAIVALGLFATAAVEGLIQAGLTPLAAALVAGGVCLAAALVFGALGRRRLDPDRLTPDRTMNDLAYDKEMVREKLP